MPEGKTEKMKCSHCGNTIWWTVAGKFRSLWNLRDKFGSICNDGYFHLPAKSAAAGKGD